MSPSRASTWLSYWLLLHGRRDHVLASFFVPAGAAQSGWTSYPPLAKVNPFWGQTMWLIGMLFLIFSSLLGAVNFLTTIIQLRVEGLTFFRLPIFVWAQFVTAFLLLLAFPPLQAAGMFQLMDLVANTSFFMPEGLVVTGEVVDRSGGGSPVLWQHLFWFLAHPEVYVLILPALGIVAEILANNTRKPLWGYKSIIYSLLFLGFVSFIVWAHHMYLTGMGTVMSAFFQTTTMIISIPSVIILTALILSLWGGSIRFTTADALRPGLPADVRHRRADRAAPGPGGARHPPARHLLRDRPLSLRGGAGDTLRAVCRGLLLVSQGDGPEDERPSSATCTSGPAIIFMNGIFFPMLIQGLAGMQRGALRRRRVLRSHPGGARVAQGDLDLGVGPGDRPDPVHRQLLPQPAPAQGSG